MTQKSLYDCLHEYPIIAAVKNEESLKKSLESESRIIFVLFGNINNIAEIVSALKSHGKIVFVHADLIDGLANREISIDFLKNHTRLDGIISTKIPLIKYAKQIGLFTVMRFFMIDSRAMESTRHAEIRQNADLIEVLPGLMPKIIRQVANFTKTPIIAGGLISDKEDVVTALSSGAVAISSTNDKVWFY